MRYELAGNDVAVLVEFTLDGEFVTPDEDSVSYIVRNTVGTIVVSTTALDPTGSQIFITVPAIVNALASGHKFENRYVIVSYTVGGVPRTLKYLYRIAAWANYTSTEDDVRSMLGVRRSELPDDEIGLYEAYLDVGKDVGEEALDAALGSASRSANEAITAKAALNVLPGLPLRVAQAEGDGTLSFQRFAKADWFRLEEQIRSWYDQAVLTVTSSEGTTVVLDVVGTRTDPITGE